MSPCRRAPWFPTLLVPLAATCPGVAGADWQMAPQVSLGVRVDENPLLTLDPARHVTATGVDAAVGVTLRRARPRHTLTISPRLLATRYRDQSALDRYEGALDLRLEQRLERGGFSIGGGVLRDSTLVSDPDDPAVVGSDRAHLRLRADAALSLDLTERWFAGAQLGTSRDDYRGDGDGRGLSDYRFHWAGARLGLRATERTVLSVDASLARQSVPDAGTGMRLRGLSVTASTRLDELWQASASIESSRILAGRFADDGISYTLRLERTGERSRFAIAAVRDAAPSALGVLTRRDRANVDLRYAVSERVEVAAGLQWTRTEDVFARIFGLDAARRYRGVSASLTWRLTEALGATFSATRRGNRGAFADREAVGSRFSVGVVWHPRGGL